MIGSRGRAIIGASVWSLAAKGCAALNVFVSVPFVIHALGPREFGAWSALIALPLVAGFLDFGFGYGAMNLVASAQGRNAFGEIRGIVRASKRALTKVGLAVAAAGTICLPIVPWFRFLGLDAPLATVAQCATAVVILSIAISIPLNVSNRLQLGIGRGDSAFRWQTLGHLLSLMSIIVCAEFGGNLTTMTAAATVPPLLAAALNSIALEKKLPAGEALITGNYDSRIWREGSQFFVIQVAAALAFSADLPLITALRGASEAGEYAIVQRLFSIVPMALSLLWAPLWPTYRHALSAGDTRWATQTLHRSIIVATVFATICAMAILFANGPILRMWIGQSQPIPLGLLCGFATWCVIEAVGTAIATYLNAASYLRAQVLTSACFATLCIGVKIFVINAFGIAWIPWTTVLTYLVASIVPLMLMRHRIANDIALARF